MNTRKSRFPVETALSILREEVKKFDVPVAELVKIQTKSPYKVLVAALISSRTNDKTTAMAAKRVFSEAGTIHGLEAIPLKRLEKLLFPVGFYKTKARHLKMLPGVLKSQFSGKIPDTVEELVRLPGVGRKTANLVVSVAFSKPAICVDTHVHRIMNRWGVVSTKTPLETEASLRKLLPKRLWRDVNRLLVAFGQKTCRPLSPKCSKCPLLNICPRLGVEKAR